MQIVVNIPEEAYKLLQTDGVDWLGAEHILNAVANGKPLDTVLDDIRAEIDKESVRAFRHPYWERAKALEWAATIINKYKAESEETDI